MQSGFPYVLFKKKEVQKLTGWGAGQPAGFPA